MRKIFLTVIFFLIFLQTSIYAEYWRADDIYYKFDFAAYPEFTSIKGEWNVDDIQPEKSIKYTFDNTDDNFFAVSGNWGIENGWYIQSETGMLATTKSMLNDVYGDFLIEFDMIPYSDENTVMIYFSGDSDSACSAEINSYQSKFIINGEEFIGEGSILKDEKYHIRLEFYDNILSFYCDDRLILSENNISLKNGNIGIGTWNSCIAFDNIDISQPSEIGVGKILNGNKNSVLVFEQLSLKNFMFESEICSDDIYQGAVGVVLFGQLNGDGYYLGINKNSVFLNEKLGNKNKNVKKVTFKPRSKNVYKLSVICDENVISVIIDDEMMFSEEVDKKNGACGFFSDNTNIKVKNVTMYFLKNISPVIKSAGNTSYYVDSEKGNDFSDGKTPETAWQTLDRVEQFEFSYGDRILLKRGSVFEGGLSLNNISGDFSVSAYGNGEIPKILSGETGISLNKCKDVDISDVEIVLKIYKGNGYGIIAENSENITVSNSVLRCIEFGGKTFAADGNDIIFDNVSVDGFSKNVVTYNGIETKNDDSEIKFHWSYKYMKQLKREGIISEYRPDDFVTRAEFSSMLIFALKLNQSDYRGIFNDVTAEDWFAVKLQTISDNRLLPNEMTPKSNVFPEAILLREEVAAISALAAGADDYSEFGFEDIEQAEEWSKKYIYAIYNYGIMSGGGDGYFKPKEKVTRAEAAVILTKLTERNS